MSLRIDTILSDLDNGGFQRSYLDDYIKLYPQDKIDVYALLRNVGIEEMQNICKEAISRGRRITVYVPERFKVAHDPPLSYKLVK